MTRRSRRWFIVATIFTLINLGGAIWAAAAGEGMHTLGHVVLLAAGAVWMWRLANGPRGHDIATATAGASDLAADRKLERIEQSLEAVAVEVERIGEAQRFNARIIAERLEKRG